MFSVFTLGLVVVKAAAYTGYSHGRQMAGLGVLGFHVMGLHFVAAEWCLVSERFVSICV